MDRRIEKITLFSCPICGMNSTDRKEIQDHFKKHTIRAEEWVYCRACGAGWSVAAWGPDGAAEHARNCYQKHIDEGNLTETAVRAFFLSGGTAGFPVIRKGGLHEKRHDIQGLRCDMPGIQPEGSEN